MASSAASVVGPGFVRIIECQDGRTTPGQVLERGEKFLRLAPFPFGDTFCAGSQRIDDQDIKGRERKLLPRLFVSERRQPLSRKTAWALRHANWMGIKNLGFIEDQPSRWTGDLDILGTFADLPALIDKYNIGQVFIALPLSRYDDARRVFDMSAGPAWQTARYFAFTFYLDRDGKAVASFPQQFDRVVSAGTRSLSDMLAATPAATRAPR